MTIKSRETRVNYSSSFILPDNSTYGYQGSASHGWQQVESISHPYWLLGKSDGDLGGPFTSMKWEVSALPSPVSLQGDLSPSNTGWRSSGVLVPSFVRDLMTGAGWNNSAAFREALVSTPDSKNQMEILGTTAIARTNPTSPVFDGATSVAELFSGFPGIPGGHFVKQLPKAARKRGVRRQDVAGDYLNYQFAVAPTVSDVRSLRRAAEESEKIIAQLERDSGKSVRRSYHFPSESYSSDNEVVWPFHPAYMGGGNPTIYEWGGSGRTVRQDSTYETSRKFTGAFKYHLPPKGSWRRKIADLDAVYGIRPGIDTAWNLVPFSWMADWYGNMGDVLTNLQAFGLDGNVLQYGYITSRTTRTIRYTGSLPVSYMGDRGRMSEYPFSWELKFTSLQRYPASPFGFGPSGGELTPRRIAILAALGLGQG